MQSKEEGFLYPGFTNHPDRTATMRRIWELADMLQNLQHAEGLKSPSVS
jgi:hypothetical protein